MKWSIPIIVFLLLASTIVVADRPQYSFSDDVFKDLPTFPSDFYEVKQLFATQSINAKQLGTNYYQPELLTSWDYWADKVYCTNCTSFGSYGVFIYPSLFNIYNVEPGTTVNISMLVYTNIGIRKYQGIHLNFSSTPNVKAKIITPSNQHLLLSPTHPYFHNDWMQLVEIQITTLNSTDSSISIFEDELSFVFENYWEQLHGNNYTSGSSLLSGRIPKCVINIHGPTPTPTIQQENTENINALLVGIFITIISILICIKLKYVNKKEKKKIE